MVHLSEKKNFSENKNELKIELENAITETEKSLTLELVLFLVLHYKEHIAHMKQEKKIMETVPPKPVEKTTREILYEIRKKDSFNEKFKEILTKTYSLHNWKFWLDLTDIIESKINDPKLPLFIQDICKKYLSSDSLEEVKIFFIFHF